MNDLWEHQRRAYQAAVDRPAYALFMGVGTGKTRVALHLAAAKSPGATLVVCPKSVMDTWQEQADRYEPTLRVVLVDGSVKQRRLALSGVRVNPERTLAVMTYEGVWRPSVADLVRSIPWTGIILDESHRIKSPGSKVSKFMAHLGKHVPWRLCLTATPMHNSPLDVYAQYRFLDPSVFGTRYDVFKMRYAVWGGFENRQVLRYVNLDELRSKMASIAFMVESDDVLDLPEYTVIHRTGELESGAMGLYRKLRRDFVAQVGDAPVTVGNSLTKLLRLQEIVSGYICTDDGERREVSAAKAQLLSETLMDLPPAEPVVIFCRFRHDIERAHRVCKRNGVRSYELSGEVNQLHAWKRNGGALVVQVQAGSVGVDLTEANVAIYYSLGFSLGEYDQSRGRLRRPGQNRRVTYIHLVLKGTIDEHILHAFAAKRDPIDYVVSALKREERTS